MGYHDINTVFLAARVNGFELLNKFLMTSFWPIFSRVGTVYKKQEIPGFVMEYGQLDTLVRGVDGLSGGQW